MVSSEKAGAMVEFVIGRFSMPNTVSQKTCIVVTDILVLDRGLQETIFVSPSSCLVHLPSHVKPAKYIAKGEPTSFPSKDSVFPIPSGTITV